MPAGPEHLKRKLAAILYADVAGYSRLTGEDEEGTHKQLGVALDLITNQIKIKGGRVVHYAGDAVLADFGSVVAVVECAVTVQRAFAEQNADIPEDRRLQFRIGINLGEVIVDRNDIYGDGVNIAARLESLAEPGGICVSASVFEQVKGKLDVGFQDMGAQEVKNITEPVRAYRVLLARLLAFDEPPPLPDKPSIAILPFVNLSGDPEQEFFADGMAEDIITGLSRYRWFFVIARNSSFTYKGRAINVKQVAQDLGVRYVLEGSVRKADTRMRVTTQLIDATAGTHIWAERYDRELKDIFAVQDEVTEAIVAAIAPEIGDVERERAQRKPPDNLDAWGLYQRGLAAYHTSTEEGLRSAIDQFDRANDLDPTFAPALAMGAGARWRYVLHFIPDNRSELLNQAREKAYKAITLDPRDPICLWNDGRVHSMLGHHDVAISKVKEAIALNPNDALSHHFLGAVLCSAGRAKEAIPHIDHAMRLSPRDIFLTGMLTHRAFLLFDLERYEEAFDWVRRASLSPNPRSMTFALLTAVLTKLGRPEEARAALNDLLAHAPGISCVKYRENPFGGPEVMERFVDALREAGLPE
ncbi:MAG: adenylate/guanylate cyclase domain-containing protein [Acidiferrobacterales bacterium]